MIGRLRGEVLEVGAGTVMLEAGGVGYEVLVPDSVLVQLPPVGDEAILTIRQVFREDSVTLYGFLDRFQRRLFDLLTEVKGCGPKSSLSLIGTLGEEAVSNAIVGQDSRALIRAPGVGPRLAERIVLELKDKLQEEALLRKAGATRARTQAQPSDELVEALLTLGYRRQEAEAAAHDARQHEGTTEDLLKIALRSLAR